ncbi:hypothetical protein BEWA_005960 [Theileria equi strain WA]|uniref:Uncharacterized protein n=1 Tax=Theileria equi strain WA TaxID=1537102 RepID=L0B0Z4_THEEQ|nr:hypothetical protein BEWA_005960 [Theileria equi strain WA]AFZ81188.1 hypothetical protein BEWA_005960 [Theileria equi strain WA]|eukprot:XP_004830854.1 hypothetical protein BEWA_005960 [Theileria equi strain WA]
MEKPRGGYIPLNTMFYKDRAPNSSENKSPYKSIEEEKENVPKTVMVDLAPLTEDAVIMSKTSSLRKYLDSGFQIWFRVLLSEGSKELIMSAVQLFDKIKLFWADIAQPLGGIHINKACLSQLFVPLVHITKKGVKVKNLPPVQETDINLENPPIESKPSRFMTLNKKKEPSIKPIETKTVEPEISPTHAPEPAPNTALKKEEKKISRWKTLNKPPTT